MKRTRLLLLSVLSMFVVMLSSCDNNGANYDSASGYVDLGLPSGLLWATHNVGATNPEDFGDYFAWGETQPKNVYDKDTYKYYDSTYDVLTTCSDSDGLTKYNESDGLTTLQPDDDAATANWGNEWRTPTEDEWQELSDNCKWTWTTYNGVNGYRIKGRNGNALFLPAAGSRWGDVFDGAGDYGSYWSNSLETDYTHLAQYFFFSDRRHRANESRNPGFSVRPVRSAR